MSHVDASVPGERPVASRVSHGEPLSLGSLPESIGFNLRKAQSAVLQRFHDAVAPHDITPGQYGVLTIVGENEGLSQSDLGNALGIDRSTMVAVIDRLEARGLVVRAPSPNDRRSYALRLSAKGQALMKELIPRIHKRDQEIIAELGDGEAERLVDCLRRIAGMG